ALAGVESALDALVERPRGLQAMPHATECTEADTVKPRARSGPPCVPNWLAWSSRARYLNQFRTRKRPFGPFCLANHVLNWLVRRSAQPVRYGSRVPGLPGRCHHLLQVVGGRPAQLSVDLVDRRHQLGRISGPPGGDLRSHVPADRLRDHVHDLDDRHTLAAADVEGCAEGLPLTRRRGGHMRVGEVGDMDVVADT